MTRNSSFSQAWVIVRSRPDAVRRGAASSSLVRKRLSTCTTVSWLRNTMAAIWVEGLTSLRKQEHVIAGTGFGIGGFIVVLAQLGKRLLFHFSPSHSITSPHHHLGSI